MSSIQSFPVQYDTIRNICRRGENLEAAQYDLDRGYLWKLGQVREFGRVKWTGTGGEASESSRKLCARSRGSSRVANGTSTGSLIPPPTPGGQLNGQKSTLRSVKVGGTFGLTGLRTFSAKIYRPVGICRGGLAKGRAYNRKLRTVMAARNSCTE